MAKKKLNGPDGADRPWMPFYAAQWGNDAAVRGMPCAARGVYIDMIAACWISGEIPGDPASSTPSAHLIHHLATCWACPRHVVTKSWPHLRHHFRASRPGFMVNHRVGKLLREMEQDSRRARARDEMRRDEMRQDEIPPLPPAGEMGGGDASAEEEEARPDYKPPLDPAEEAIEMLVTRWHFSRGGARRVVEAIGHTRETLARWSMLQGRLPGTGKAEDPYAYVRTLLQRHRTPEAAGINAEDPSGSLAAGAAEEKRKARDREKLRAMAEPKQMSDAEWRAGVGGLKRAVKGGV